MFVFFPAYIVAIEMIANKLFNRFLELMEAKVTCVSRKNAI